MNLDKNYKLEQLAKADNAATLMSDHDLTAIGEYLHRGFEADMLTRADWEKRNADAMKLALQVVEKKSFPWPNASNIKFPLVTIAALQFHSRAYPQLISGSNIVKMRVIGDDPDGSKTSRAHRIESHMSYQVLEEDEGWEEEMDKVLIHTPIIGCSFKKTYFSPFHNHIKSEFIPASALVVDYYAKSLEDAQRVTHILLMSPNDIYERKVNGYYLDVETQSVQPPVMSKPDHARDKAQGINQPSDSPDTPLEVLEMHTLLDLDGDGYQEPYIVTMRRDNHQVLRIGVRFLLTQVKKDLKDRVLSIKAEQYFTKYPFIPSPDGGFYDLGFGSLLGPLNESINTLINQITDAGTLATTAGGFLAKGAKLRGGNTTFAPMEWKNVDATGDDLKKSILPLPVREPSPVLFQLLGLMINYGERIGMSVDIMVGENPGQNTPAQTSQTMVEQGMKIFNGIYKRTYRGLRDEFRKIYRLNRLNLPKLLRFGDNKQIVAEDYQGSEGDVVPAADPNIVSDSQRLIIATTIKQAAMQTNGYNKYKVERMFLEALKISNVDELFPDPQGPNAVPPMPNPKVQIEELKGKVKQMEVQTKAKIEAAKLMQKAEESQAKVKLIEAQIMEIEANVGNLDKHNQIELLKATMQHHQARQDDALDAAKFLMESFIDMKELELDAKQGSAPAK